MEIKEIKISCEGYVFCRSSFYSVCDVLTNGELYLKQGANVLRGEIDSGMFGISYMLSMYEKTRSKDTFFVKALTANECDISLGELNKHSCYLDRAYSTFSSNQSVEKLIIKGLKKSGIPYTKDDIRDIFKISSDRFMRPLCSMGNESFSAMAAIGYSMGKQIFCFPWLSKMRYEGFNLHLPMLLDTLTDLNKIAVLPLGN